MEQRRIKWVEEEVKQTEAHSAGSKDVESQFVAAVVVAVVVAAAAVSEPEFDLVLPVKQVEVELVSVIVPMNHDPTHIEEEAAVVGGAVAAAADDDDVAVPGPTVGPIHFDLHLGQRLKMLVGGWCSSNSIVAIVESEVAAEDWMNCQKEATHLPPNQYDHRLLQTLHYLCPLPLLLLTHEQRVHDVPQTRNEEHLPHDYLSADRQVATRLHPQHPGAKEVTAVTGGGAPSSSLSKILL